VVDAEEGSDLLAATTPEEFVRQISTLLNTPELAATIGKNARERVIDRYSWEAHMGAIDRYISITPSP